VIGVAGDVKEALDPRSPLQLDARPTIYRPASQEPVASMTIIVRTERDPLTFAAATRTAVAAVDPTIPVMTLRSVRQGLTESVQTPRFNAVLLTAFAVLALLLAAVGVYGVIAYAVERRTREIGIRIALGANRSRVLAQVIRHGLLLTTIGVVAGLAGAFALNRLIAFLLFGVQPTDVATLAAVTATILLVAGLASYLPARRASRVDPMVALRCE
jgi:putative ABC transport system permease protein